MVKRNDAVNFGAGKIEGCGDHLDRAVVDEAEGVLQGVKNRQGRALARGMAGDDARGLFLIPGGGERHA